MPSSPTSDRYGTGTIRSSRTDTFRRSPSTDRFCYSPRAGQVTSKLDHVSGKFTSLYSDLETEKQHKRLSENERFSVLKERVDTLEHSLAAEADRRHEADRSLQLHVDAELQKLSDRMNSQMHDLQLMLKGSLDQMNRSVNELNATLSDEREQRRADVDHVGTTLCARLDETLATMEDERFARLEQERESLKRIGEDLYKINERIDCEKSCREQMFNDLAGEVHDFVNGRTSREEQFNTSMLEEVSALRAKLNTEISDRIQEDEAIVHAVNEYTRALQEGLRIVGSS